MNFKDFLEKQVNYIAIKDKEVLMISVVELGNWAFETAITNQLSGGKRELALEEINRLIECGFSVSEAAKGVEEWRCPSRLYLWQIAISCLGAKTVLAKLKGAKNE